MARETPQEFVGRLFGKEEHLTVIGVGSKQGDKQMFRVYCSTCAQDPELFGDAVFEMTKGNLSKGAIPCGCARSPRWSEQQNITLAKRKLEGTDTEFVALAEPYRGTETKITLRCTKHNITWSLTNFQTLLSKKTKGMCIECEKELISDFLTEDEDSAIAAIVATGAFPAGSTFWRTPSRAPTKSGVPGKQQWGMLCGICSYDEYVEEGLCDGVFTTSLTDLKNGRRPCRCSGHFRYTLAQKEHQFKQQAASVEHLEYIGLKYSQVGFKHTSKLQFWGRCKVHGEFFSSAAHTDQRGMTCPKCCRFGFQSDKAGYVYVLKINGMSESFTGYGISNQPEQRFKEHTNNLRSYGMTIADSVVYKFTGKQALVVEKEIQNAFPLQSQDIVGFKTEATHSDLYSQVATFVSERCAFTQ